MDILKSSLWMKGSKKASLAIEAPVYNEDNANKTLAASTDCFLHGKQNYLDLPETPSGLLNDDPSLLATTLGGSICTLSQPSSATSSLASLTTDYDLQVASRQSSGSDLGARPFASPPLFHGLPPRTSPFLDSGACNSARSDTSITVEDSLDLILQFDMDRTQSLRKIKTISPSSSLSLSSRSSSSSSSSSSSFTPSSNSSEPTPAAPMACKPVSQPTFSVDADSTAPKVLPVRPLRVRASLPGTYNPYDLASLLANFKMNKNNQNQNRVGGGNSSACGNGCAVPAACATMNNVAKQGSVSGLVSTSVNDPVDKKELDGIVMIPGMKRNASGE